MEANVFAVRCEEFAAKGCVVYATARKVESISGLKHGFIYRRVLDVNNQDDVQAAVQDVIETEGRIDILVNNAGMLCVGAYDSRMLLPSHFSPSGPTMDVPDEQVVRTFDTNVFGILRMSRAVFPHMAKRRSGLIINIGSIAGEL